MSLEAREEVEVEMKELRYWDDREGFCCTDDDEIVDEFSLALGLLNIIAYRLNFSIYPYSTLPLVRELFLSCG